MRGHFDAGTVYLFHRRSDLEIDILSPEFLEIEILSPEFLSPEFSRIPQNSFLVHFIFCFRSV